jgi:GNAT superfamily N-acetyltransferase
MEQQIEVRRVRGDDPLARELVAAMEAELTPQFGPITPDHTSTVTPEEMVPPAGTFVLVVEEDRVVAGGGVRRLSDGVAEIKRMYVVPESRGRGPGRRRGDARGQGAGDLGYTRMRLDTAAPLTVALAMYRAAGYRDIPDYNGNRYATFWGEKDLTAAR